MQRSVLEHADLITLDADGRVLRDTALGIEGREIAWIGRAPRGWSDVPRENLSGHVVMPGFWNAHTHAPMTLTRSIAEDLPLDRWFNEGIWVAESALTEEDVYWGALLAAAEMIRSGTVGFADHYFYMSRIAEVVEQSGLKALLAPALFGSNEVDLSFEDSVEWVLHFQGAAGGRIRTALGPHSTYVCPPDFLREVAAVARDEELGVHIHLSEEWKQVEVSKERYGLTPVEHLEELGIFDAPTLAAHCIAVSESDVALLARRGVTPVQCPQCHMKLGMGTTPVPEMLAAGIPVALGTDGPASNNNLAMLEEAQLAALVQKMRLSDATAMAGDLPLRLATVNGARALGFADSGALAPGMAADLIVLDASRPHLVPRHSLVGNVLYAAGSGDILHSMVDGRWLMRDRRLLTLDEPRIVAEAERRGLAMLARAHGQHRAYEG